MRKSMNNDEEIRAGKLRKARLLARKEGTTLPSIATALLRIRVPFTTQNKNSEQDQSWLKMKSPNGRGVHHFHCIPTVDDTRERVSTKY
jgi:hypothetical protein